MIADRRDEKLPVIDKLLRLMPRAIPRRTRLIVVLIRYSLPFEVHVKIILHLSSLLSWAAVNVLHQRVQPNLYTISFSFDKLIHQCWKLTLTLMKMYGNIGKNFHIVTTVFGRLMINVPRNKLFLLFDFPIYEVFTNIYLNESNKNLIHLY